MSDSAYPIRYTDIAKAQETDAELQQKLVSNKDYTLDIFCGGDKYHRLICRNNKICLPQALQKKTVDWYPLDDRASHDTIIQFSSVVP